MRPNRATKEQKQYTDLVIEGIVNKFKQYNWQVAKDLEMHYKTVEKELQDEWELALEQSL